MVFLECKSLLWFVGIFFVRLFLMFNPAVRVVGVSGEQSTRRPGVMSVTVLYLASTHIYHHFGVMYKSNRTEHTYCTLSYPFVIRYSRIHGSIDGTTGRI